jgi:hypothetical protein
VEGLEGLMLETNREKLVQMEEEIHQRQLEQQKQESDQLLVDMKKNHEKIAERERSRIEQEMNEVIQPVLKEKSKLRSFLLSNYEPASSTRQSVNKDFVIEKRGDEDKQLENRYEEQECRINNVVTKKHEKQVSVESNSSMLQRRSNLVDGMQVPKFPLPPSTPSSFMDSWMAKRKAEEDTKKRSSENSFAKKQKLKEEEERLNQLISLKAKAEAAKELELSKKLEFGKVQKARAYDALIAAKKREYNEIVKLHEQLEKKLKNEQSIVAALRKNDLEVSRGVIGVQALNSNTASMPPVNLDQLMGRLVQNNIRVCDYATKTQFSSQNSACGKVLRVDEKVMREALTQLKEKEAQAWDNTIIKTAEAENALYKAQEALDCSLQMLMAGAEGERITEAIISPKAPPRITAPHKPAVFHMINTLRSEDKTVVSNKFNGTVGTEFYYEGVTTHDSEVRTADSFQSYYDMLFINIYLMFIYKMN